MAMEDIGVERVELYIIDEVIKKILIINKIHIIRKVLEYVGWD